jgi:hypothetical protein
MPMSASDMAARLGIRSVAPWKRPFGNTYMLKAFPKVVTAICTGMSCCSSNSRRGSSALERNTTKRHCRPDLGYKTTLL